MATEDRGTAQNLGAATEYPQGYRLEGRMLSSPTGIQFRKQADGLDVSSRGCTVHIPFNEWSVITNQFAAEDLAKTQTSSPANKM